jgi:hypothetical protein
MGFARGVVDEPAGAHRKVPQGDRGGVVAASAQHRVGLERDKARDGCVEVDAPGLLHRRRTAAAVKLFVTEARRTGVFTVIGLTSEPATVNAAAASGRSRPIMRWSATTSMKSARAFVREMVVFHAMSRSVLSAMTSVTAAGSIAPVPYPRGARTVKRGRRADQIGRRADEGSEAAGGAAGRAWVPSGRAASAAR